MVATVKSRSAMVGLTPAGSLTELMWIEFAQVVAFEVHGDVLGDFFGAGLDFDLVADDVQHAAALQARRLLGIDELDRDGDGDPRFLADAQEVHVDRNVGDRVELNVTRQHMVGCVTDLDVEQVGEKARGAQNAFELQTVQRNRYRLFLVAVDYGGDPASAARLTGNPLAGPVTCLSGENCSFGHTLLHTR